MKTALTLCFVVVFSLRAEWAWSQTVLERVLLLLDSPAMVALNLLETASQIAPQAAFGPSVDGVDGSIRTTIYGLGLRNRDLLEARSQGLRLAVLAVDLGLAETTALGGVNTGNIGFSSLTPDMDTLNAGIAIGVQAALTEVQTAGTHAVAAGAQTLGGSADSTTLAANISSNGMRVQGQVTHVLSAVSVRLSHIRATGLGAVNTGAIVSGVDTTVRGITGVAGRSTMPP